MTTDSKPKHVILQDFTAVLHKRNPMNLSLDNDLEYESEALSILSRFCEAAIHIPDDEALCAQVAVGIVKQSFEFWFEETGNSDVESLARELLATYREAVGIKPTPAISEDFVTEPEPSRVVIG